MKRLFWFVLFIALISGLSYTQTKRTIRGRVSDQGGKPLANVKVEVFDTSIITKTLSDGTFALVGLELGKYQLKFTHSDYVPEIFEVTVGEKPGKLIKVILPAKNPILLTIKEEITVTAQADSIIDISLPSHRTILPSSVLTELGTTNIAEAVEKVPGVAMVGKGGYSMAPSIRGLAEHRILLLMDGVRLTSERRIGTSASFINLNYIDRIEINRGPYSVFYGSGAIGGVINIVTKTPAPDAPLKGDLRLGYNTIRKEGAASVNLSAPLGKFAFMIAANGKNAGDYSSPAGIIEQSHYSDYDLLLKVSRTGDNSQFYLTFLNYWGVDIGKPSPTARLKPRWYPKERNTIFTLGYKIQNTLYLDTLNASFYFLLPMLETRKDNLSESLTVEKRNLAKIEGSNFGFKVRGGKRLGETHTLNFGFDFFGRRGVNDSNTEWIFDDFGNITEKTEETSLLDGRRNNFGLYIDDKIQISPSVTMNFGARFDYINTSNFTHSSNKISKSDQSFTAYIGSIFQVTQNFSLLANLGRSFRFPTMSELFYTGLTGRGTVLGNVDLKPERSVNLDLGFRYFHKKFYASIYGFRNSVSDLIQKYSGAGEDEYYYRNLTRGHITGIEGEFYFWLIENCELFINFHHMVGREKNTDASLNHVPASRLTFWIKFSPGKFWAEPKITFAAHRKDPGPLEIEIKGYTLVDAIFGYEFNHNLTLLAIAQNVLNKTYRLSADEKGVDAPGRGIVFKISYSF
ncbi:MAG: TonB-dependent receptor [Candidatus Aminicenantes bacterium]|nr:TonB-dependent receptor [Candidatus Aminicenantes bacterium]